MQRKDIENIGIILGQFGGPISLNYSIKNRNIISEELVDYHKKKYENIEFYSTSDYFSLMAIIQFVIDDLGEDEFNLITGLDLYLDGYVLLNKVKSFI